MSVQRALLEVTAQEESDIPSTSSMGSVAGYYGNNDMRENLSRPFQILGMF